MTGFADGVPSWADLTVPDVAAGQEFYGGLFGWSFADVPGDELGRYHQAYLGDDHVAALIPQQDPGVPASWTVHLASADAAATVTRVKKAGGTIILGPGAVGPLGTVALAADPEGAVFGIWQPGTHEGFQRTGEPGSFAWAEVLVRDAARTDAFYESVFGYTAEDVTADLRLWGPAGGAPRSGTAVASRRLLHDDAPARFEARFAVTDCDAAAATAARLGGTVLKEPFSTFSGRLAVLEDNQGVTFVVVSR